jgi:hypothetical protein
MLFGSRKAIKDDSFVPTPVDIELLAAGTFATIDDRSLRKLFKLSLSQLIQQVTNPASEYSKVYRMPIQVSLLTRHEAIPSLVQDPNVNGFHDRSSDLVSKQSVAIEAKGQCQCGLIQFSTKNLASPCLAVSCPSILSGKPLCFIDSSHLSLSEECAKKLDFVSIPLVQLSGKQNENSSLKSSYQASNDRPMTRSPTTEYARLCADGYGLLDSDSAEEDSPSDNRHGESKSVRFYPKKRVQKKQLKSSMEPELKEKEHNVNLNMPLVQAYVCSSCRTAPLLSIKFDHDSESGAVRIGIDVSCLREVRAKAPLSLHKSLNGQAMPWRIYILPSDGFHFTHDSMSKIELATFSRPLRPSVAPPSWSAPQIIPLNVFFVPPPTKIPQPSLKPAQKKQPAPPPSDVDSIEGAMEKPRKGMLDASSPPSKQPNSHAFSTPDIARLGEQASPSTGSEFSSASSSSRRSAGMMPVLAVAAAAASHLVHPRAVTSNALVAGVVPGHLLRDTKEWASRYVCPPSRASPETLPSLPMAQQPHSQHLESSTGAEPSRRRLEPTASSSSLFSHKSSFYGLHPSMPSYPFASRAAPPIYANALQQPSTESAKALNERLMAGAQSHYRIDRDLPSPISLLASEGSFSRKKTQGAFSMSQSIESFNQPSDLLESPRGERTDETPKHAPKTVIRSGVMTGGFASRAYGKDWRQYVSAVSPETKLQKLELESSLPNEAGPRSTRGSSAPPTRNSRPTTHHVSAASVDPGPSESLPSVRGNSSGVAFGSRATTSTSSSNAARSTDGEDEYVQSKAEPSSSNRGNDSKRQPSTSTNGNSKPPLTTSSSVESSSSVYTSGVGPVGTRSRASSVSSTTSTLSKHASASTQSVSRESILKPSMLANSATPTAQKKKKSVEVSSSFVASSLPSTAPKQQKPTLSSRQTTRIA